MPRPGGGARAGPRAGRGSGGGAGGRAARAEEAKFEAHRHLYSEEYLRRPGTLRLARTQYLLAAVFAAAGLYVLWTGWVATDVERREYVADKYYVRTDYIRLPSDRVRPRGE